MTVLPLISVCETDLYISIFFITHQKPITILVSLCSFYRHRSRIKRIATCTLLFYLSDLFHSFLQDCTFVRLDIEVVDVIEVGEDQLRELFDVFVFMLAVALLVAALGTAGKRESNERRMAM